MTAKKIWQSSQPAVIVQNNAQTLADQAQKKPSRAELELVLKKVQELVRKNPEKAAIILNTWVNPQSAKKASV